GGSDSARRGSEPPPRGAAPPAADGAAWSGDILRSPTGHGHAELLLGRGRRELAHDLAFDHDEDPVGQRDNLLELERDEQDSSTLVSLLDQAAVDELDRPDVESPRRLGRHQGARIPVDLPGEDDLLLVA